MRVVHFSAKYGKIEEKDHLGSGKQPRSAEASVVAQLTPHYTLSMTP